MKITNKQLLWSSNEVGLRNSDGIGSGGGGGEDMFRKLCGTYFELCALMGFSINDTGPVGLIVRLLKHAYAP